MHSQRFDPDVGLVDGNQSTEDCGGGQNPTPSQDYASQNAKM
jgi:hypothetical protein